MNDPSKYSNPVEKRLADWQVSTPIDPQLKQHVLRRIAVVESEKSERSLASLGLLRWIGRNPLATSAIACAALLMASTTLLLFREHDIRSQFAAQQSYFMMIDPVAHINAMSNGMKPGKEPSVVDTMAWMKERFNLSREQFLQLDGLHREYSDHLTTLFRELSASETDYQNFETQRRQNGMIDFMALYDLLQKRDALREDSTKTSRQLVELVLRVLTPEQKREYLSLLNGNTDILPLSETPKTHAGA